MYLSGPPLHVITLGLVERVRRARPEVPLSFSAGVDNRNFADCVALGLAPVTVCTDLLKPGGYGRLPKYLENLEERMRGLGVRNVPDYVKKANGHSGEAIARAVARAREDLRYRAEALRPPRRSAGTSPSSTASTATSACPPARTTPTSSTRPSHWRGITRAITSREARRPGGGWPFRGARAPPDRRLPGLLQRLRQLRHVLPRGRRAVPREAPLLRLARGLAGAGRACVSFFVEGARIGTRCGGA